MTGWHERILRRQGKTEHVSTEWPIRAVPAGVTS